MARPRPAVLENPDFGNVNAPANWRTRWSGRTLNVVGLAQNLLHQAFGNEIPFMVSKPYFDDPTNAESWEPVRMLGKGGFGRVGLWRKNDENGTIIDELAIKEMQRNPGRIHTLEIPSVPGLLQEAVIQRDLNLQMVQSILHLRGYKVFAHEEMYRLYFEYSPYGDLSRLKKLYNAWDQYIPELFLWHLFHSLILAGQAMEQSPPAASEALLDIPVDNRYMTVHFDIKPQNILLDYPPGNLPDDDPTGQYPVIKLSDFGLAVYTHALDNRNPDNFWTRRTRMFEPPEQRGYGAHWQRPPTGAHPRVDAQGRPLYQRQEDAFAAQKQDRQRDVVFTAPHNIFAIGKVMFDMLVLLPSSALVGFEAKTQEIYQLYGSHSIPTLSSRNQPGYSIELRTLIRDCLRPNPNERPNSQDVFTATQNGLNAAKTNASLRRAQAGNIYVPLPEEKICLTMDDFNQMPLGPAGFAIRPQDLQWITERQFFDPFEASPQLPHPKWAFIHNQYRTPPPIFQIQDGNVYFGNNMPRFNIGTAATPVTVIGPGQGAGQANVTQNQSTVTVVPGRLPTAADYNRLDKRTLADELIHRDNTNRLEDLMRADIPKQELVRRLIVMDAAGNLGHGAQLRRPNTRTHPYQI